MDFNYVVAPAAIVVICALAAWLSVRRMLSPTQKNLGPLRRVCERVALSLTALLAVAVAVNCAWNAIAIQVFRATNPPLGNLYQVNGHKMQIYCMGSGSPTVVLEAGLGVAADVLSWGDFQPKLGLTTRVCSYDRAGLGWSEPQRDSSDADHIAANLHQLLAQANVTGPVVLMGHSMGGVYLRDYLAHYPAGVAGLVLVDSSTPLQEQRFQALAGPQKGLSTAAGLKLQKILYILGVPRLVGQCGRPAPGWESRAGKALGEDECQPKDEALSEYENLPLTGEETVHTGPFGAIPILIFSQDTTRWTAGPNPTKQAIDEANLWYQMQEDLKKLSTRSRRIIARGSGHYVQGDREDLVLKETELFIDQIRGTAPQPGSYGSTITE
jgi:pimeloyl-ACP methyl ester carboxylesterase